MKDKYEAPSAEIISFEDSDVITTSTGTTGKSDVQTPSVVGSSGGGSSFY